MEKSNSPEREEQDRIHLQYNTQPGPRSTGQIWQATQRAGTSQHPKTSHIHHIHMPVPSRSGHHRPFSSSSSLRIQNISDKLALFFEPQCVTKWKANRPYWTRIPLILETPCSMLHPPSSSWTMQECARPCLIYAKTFLKRS